MIGAVKVLNQLELVGETLRHALNVLATVAPDWLKQHAQAAWFDRYGERMEDYRLPKEKTERERLSAVIGEDGYYLLDAVEYAHELAWLKQLPAVQAFAQVWKQQYRRDQGRVERLTPKAMVPVGEWIRSPYDPEVRSGKKRDFHWVGYKVHLTECCEENLPHLITKARNSPCHRARPSCLGGHSSGRELQKIGFRPSTSWTPAISAPSGSCIVGMSILLI